MTASQTNDSIGCPATSPGKSPSLPCESSRKTAQRHQAKDGHASARKRQWPFMHAGGSKSGGSRTELYMMPAQNPIPALFPGSLQDKCVDLVLRQLVEVGKVVEEKARREVKCRQMTRSHEDQRYGALRCYGKRRVTSKFSDYLEASSFFSKGTMLSKDEPSLTQVQSFRSAASVCRSYLMNFVSSHLLDLLASTSRREGCSETIGGSIFCFSVLCNQRLNRLVACHIGERSDWASFMSASVGQELLTSCLSRLEGLSYLTLHGVCTNEMLGIVADTCTRLQVLDISYSGQVTDLGLIYLCGATNNATIATSPHHHDTSLFRRPARGCRFLRELRFNPQNGLISDEPTESTAASSPMVMPKVIACLLRNLPLLEVMDVCHLHEGIDYYFHGGGAGCYRPRPERLAPLKLLHYTGFDKLAEVMPICPKLHTFKLFVTDALPRLGETLADNCLDHVTLVFSQSTLLGLEEFLQACGHCISSLELECATPETYVQMKDLQSVVKHCKFLETLRLTSFRISPTTEDFPEPFTPLQMPFLTELRMSVSLVECHGKKLFRALLGGCPDVERVWLSFTDNACYFSDFLLDDILAMNPLGRLEQFIVSDVSVTLISALRLISSRPKLRAIGKLLKWDVEPTELQTFAQILRRANSLKLLQEISII